MHTMDSTGTAMSSGMARSMHLDSKISEAARKLLKASMEGLGIVPIERM